MLVSFALQNILSFQDGQALSMEAVSRGKDDINPLNTFSAPGSDHTQLLKSALIFGANASGKSNFIRALSMFRNILLHSQAALEENDSPTRSVIPFLLAQENTQQPSVMEVVFYEAGTRYRYGLEIQDGRVVGEWLFYTPSARETLLFNREGQAVEYNKQGFSEAAPFIKEGKVQQTRDSVPFVSLLATHDGMHSQHLVRWVNRLAIISGTQEQGYMRLTTDLMKKDSEFKAWLLDILHYFQIVGLSVVEVETPEVNLDVPSDEVDLQNFLSSLNRLSKNKKSQSLMVTKPLAEKNGTRHVDFPLSFESEGTKKLIHLLGPIYDSIQNKRILIIDELEAKFHSLLTRYLFRIYHQKNATGSQIIAAAHDTSLMSTQEFRRDQIWFIDKNRQGSSEIYSLVEFKERARQLKAHYGQDYLAGAFGAVSLFDNPDDIAEMM